MSRPRLRHIAFVVQDAKEMADFYTSRFGMELFHVESVEPYLESLEPKPALRGGDRPFAEYRAIDPEGNWFDLSAHGFLPPGIAE